MSNARSKPVLILALVAVAVIGVGAWVALSGGPAPQLDDARSKDDATAVVPASHAPRVDLTASEPVVAAPTPVRESANDLSVGDAVPELDELNQALWVEGHVTVPVGTPADERVHLFADGRSFKKSKGHRVRLGDDGRFRIAFAKGTKVGSLRLEARYLFLREPLSLKLADLAGPVELAPELGAVIRGRLELEDATPELRARAAQLTVVAQGQRMGGLMTMVHRNAKLGPDLSFELLAIPTDTAPQLQLESAFLVPVREVTVPVRPGEIVQQDLKTTAGRTLRVRAVDEQGAPVAKAQIEVQPDWQWMAGRSLPYVRRQAPTDADGRATLEGLPVAHMKLECAALGYKPIERSLDTEKDDLTAYALVLERGLFVEGVVLWPDGSAAQGARVRWGTEKVDNDFDPSDPSSVGVEADAQGRFRISGLAEASYILHATATRKLDDPSSEKATKKKRESLSARIPEIRAGSTGVELRLGSGLAVAGSVVDDLGAPLASFSVRARKHVENGWTNDGVARSFKASPFELDGLQEGEWKISATAPGHSRSAEILISLPGSPPPLRLVAPRECVLTGRVVDAAGAPVKDAMVRWDSDEGDDFDWGAFRSQSASSKSDGTFRVDSVRAGKGKLVARSNEGADSNAVELVLVPGQTVADIDLRMAGLGELRGVLDASIAARDKRRVTIQEVEREHRGFFGGSQRETLTDAQGGFEFVRVPEGEWTVALEPTEEENASEAGQLHDWYAREARRKKQDATIVAGRVTEVVLGGPDSGSIRVHGRITRSGRPAESVHVSARLMSEGNRFRTVKTDGTGRYELRLADAGKYWIGCSSGSGTQHGEQHDLAEGSETLLDFALADGTLAGRVLAPNGEPIRGCSIQLQQRGDGKSGAGRGHVGGNTQPSDDGEFRFDLLDAGTYAIEVNFWDRGKLDLADQEFGPFELAVDEQRTDLELKLVEAGRLKLVLGQAEAPERRATRILLWDEDTHRATTEWVFGETRQTLHPQPGRYQVLAFGDTSVSHWKSAEVVKGKLTEVELPLECSATLSVEVVRSNGERAPCRLEVRDERELDLASLLRRNGGPGEDGWHRLGALPPGTYRLVASNDDGELGSKEIVLGTSGANEVRIDAP